MLKYGIKSLKLNHGAYYLLNKGRPLLQGPLIGSVPSVALRHLPTPWGVTLFRKQFTGLFSEFTLAERLRIISLFFKSCEQRPEALPLDSAKGTQSLWNPFHGFSIIIAVSD